MLLITIISSLIRINLKNVDIEAPFEGVLENYTIDGNKISFILKSKYSLKCTYYIKDENELNFLKNLNLGIVLRVEGNVDNPKNNTIPNTFNYKKYLLSKKIYYTFTVKKMNIKENINIQYKIKNSLIDRIEKLNSPYLYAFVLGDTSFIDSSIKSTYQSNGISHLLAISGMHITLLFSTIYKLLEKIKRTKFNILFVFILLFFYLFLVNFTPSSIRAGLMFIVLLLFKKMKSYNEVIK